MDNPLFHFALLSAIFGLGCVASYAVGRWHERQLRSLSQPERPLVSDTRVHVESMQQIAHRLARFSPPLSE